MPSPKRMRRAVTGRAKFDAPRPHDAALLERADRGGQITVQHVELARGDRAAGERIDELALAHRPLGGLKGAPLLGEAHPTRGDGRDGRRLIRYEPSSRRTTLAAPPGGSSSRRHSEIGATYSRAHPKRELGRGGRRTPGRGNDIANGSDAGRVEAVRAAELGQAPRSAR